MNRITSAMGIGLALFSLGVLCSCSGGSGAQPALQITVNSLPNGTVGTAYNQTITAVNGTGLFQWSVSSGSMPSHLSLGNSTSNSDTITGTPDTKMTAVQFTIQVKDSKGHTATQAYTLNINNPAAPSIDASNTPSTGAVTVPYSFTFAASGGLAPMGWTESGTLPAGLALAGNGTLFGKPTAFGSFPISVTVTDNLGQMDTKPFTVVTDPSGITNTRLSGHYAFVFQGFTGGAANAFILAGSFVADGAGNITGGHLDRNGIAEAPAADTTFTGTYSFDATDQGTIEIKNAGAGLDLVLRFVTMGPAGSPATSARIVEYDNVAYGTGNAFRQDPTSFSNAGITNDYIFQLAGTTVGDSHAAAAGRFKADGAGSVSNAVMDVNVAGTVFSDAAFTMTYAVPNGSTSGRGTAILNVTLGGAQITLHFTVYVVSSTEAYFISSDTTSASTPLYTGATAQQTGAPFSKASMNGSFVFITQGAKPAGVSGGLADSTLGLITMDGAGKVTFSADENMFGTISAPNFTGSYNIDANGRVTLTGQANPPVLYLSGDVGFMANADANASGGTFHKQSQDAAAISSLSGTVALYTTLGAANLWNVTSETAFSGGLYNGYWDVGIAYYFPRTDIFFHGDYSIAANGRGLAHAGNFLLAIYVVGKNTFVLDLSNSASDDFPGLMVGTCQQTSTAGFGSCP